MDPVLAEEVVVSEVVYRSEITVEREAGPLRRATLPGEVNPIFFGVHGAIAEHYGRAPGTFDAHATTIDYVVAATAG
jgi:hypothetical protein